MTQRARGPIGEWWHHKVPAQIIAAYRSIPEERRSKWSFGASTSHLAAANPSWETLFHYGTPVVELKSTKSRNVLLLPLLLIGMADGVNWETTPPRR